MPGRAGPDREFGSTIAVLRLSNDDRPDVALAARGQDSEDARVMCGEEHAGGVLADGDADEDAGGRGLAGGRPAGRADPPGEGGRELIPTFV